MTNLQTIAQKAEGDGTYGLYAITVGVCTFYLICAQKAEECEMALLGKEKGHAAELFERFVRCAVSPEHLSDVVRDFHECLVKEF